MRNKKEQTELLRLQRNHLIREGRWEEALEVANKLLSIAPTASRYTRRSMILIKLRRYNEAIADIEKALAIDPQESRAEKILAKLVTKTGGGRHPETPAVDDNAQTATAGEAVGNARSKAKNKKARDSDAMPRMEDDEGPVLYSLTEAFLAQQVDHIMTERRKSAPASAITQTYAPEFAITDIQEKGGATGQANSAPAADKNAPKADLPADDSPAASDPTMLEEETTDAGSPNPPNPQDESAAPADMATAPTIYTASAGQGESESGIANALTEVVGEALADAGRRGRRQPETDDDALRPGTQLGDYVVQEKIGQGGMGSVYKASHKKLNQVVAIKVLPSQDVSEERVRRFNQEAQLAAQLQHPHIVPIFHFGVEKGLYYLVMHWVDGVPLNTLLAEKRLTPRQALDIMQQVAQAMSCAHAAGVIHRDLKPSNIMIDRWGRALVLDFGLAKSLATGNELTRSGQILGTPKYMSPEQAAGDLAAVDTRTDVYAMGVILYEMLTGRCPFEAESAHNIIYQILHQEPVAPKKLNPRLHKDLQTLVEKAMAREKFRRYAHAGELQEDIDRYIHGETIQAQPPSIAYRTYKWAVRHPAASGMLALTLLFVLGLAVWYRFVNDPHCKLKAMYQQAQSDIERDTLLGALVGQAVRQDIAFLRRVFDDGTPHQQALALRLLADVGYGMKQERLEECMAGKDDEMVRAAIYAAGKYRRRGIEPRLHAFLAPEYDWRTRLLALEALSEMNSSEAIPLCVAALADNCAVREVVRKILLRRREEALPHLLATFLGDYNANIWEAGRVLQMMGSPVLPVLAERLPQCDTERQIRILKVVKEIQDPAAVDFLFKQLAVPQLERKALTLLQDLHNKYPQNRRLAEIVAEHRRTFHLLVEAQCFGVLREKLEHKIRVLPVQGVALQSPSLVVQLPVNMRPIGQHYQDKPDRLQLGVPLPLPTTGAELKLELAGFAVGTGECVIELHDGGRVIDTIKYVTEVLGVAGAHCNIYDTEDPIGIGKDTIYRVEIGNEGQTTLTSVRCVSQVTPELEIVEVTPAELSAPAKITSYGKDRAVVFVTRPLQPGEKFAYSVKCRAVNIGSGLHTASVTYDQFTREINLSEGTLIYWR